MTSYFGTGSFFFTVGLFDGTADKKKDRSPKTTVISYPTHL